MVGVTNPVALRALTECDWTVVCDAGARGLRNPLPAKCPPPPSRLSRAASPTNQGDLSWNIVIPGIKSPSRLGIKFQVTPGRRGSRALTLPDPIKRNPCNIEEVAVLAATPAVQCCCVLLMHLLRLHLSSG